MKVSDSLKALLLFAPQSSDTALTVMARQENYFALFGLPETFDVDLGALERAYSEVQKRVQPDLLAQRAAPEQDVARNEANCATEAVAVLRDPLQRAIHLCHMRGQDPLDGPDIGMSPKFLEQEREWRDGLNAYRASVDPTSMEALRMQLVAALATEQDIVARAFADNDLDVALERTRQWISVDRLTAEVIAAERQASAPSR